MHKLLHLLFIMSLSPAAVKAQGYYFKSYQVRDGLASNTVTSIIQDKNGFMWLGSRNGLNRFDGNTFKIYRNDKNNRGLGSSSILSLYEDDRGSMWVGTTKGVYVYNDTLESFKLLTGIPATEVRTITGLGNKVWVVADGKIHEYNLANTRITKIDLGMDTKSISLDKQRNIMLAFSGETIVQLNLQNGQKQTINLPQTFPAEKTTQIQDAIPINDSTLLIGTFNRVYKLNIAKKRLNNIFDAQPVKKDVQVHAFVEQKKGVYWIGSEDGIYVYDLPTGTITHIPKQQYNPYSISDNVILTFCKDTEGSIWIGTFFGGVNYYSDQFNNFRKYMPGVGHNTIRGSLVHEICPDNFGNLWVGTEDAGLNKISLATGAITNYYADGRPGSISYNNIHGMAAVGEELWVGTFEHGLDVLNIKTGKVIRHYNGNDNKSGLNGNFIVALFKTHDNALLAATWNGLHLFNRELNKFEKIPQLNSQVQGIIQDKNGILWLATYGNGVFVYNMQTQTVQNIRSDSRKANRLLNNYVNGLYEDHLGNIWFCTEGGLSKYSRDGHFKNYTMDNGMPDNQVYRILEDEQNQLWVSTARGLVLLNPDTDVITVFKSADGLPTEQFNYNSSYKSPDGKLYFGTLKGMISFNPTNFFKNNFVPPVFISDIRINNAQPNLGPNSILKKSILYLNTITLPYDSSNLVLDIATLSYLAPESNKIKYILEGYDESWNIISGNQSINYNKLPPGKFTLKIFGANNSGLWSDQEKTLLIQVTPPVWASAWAYALYALTAFFISYLLFRYYNIALRAKNSQRIEVFEREKERELYNLKMDFFTNVTHEIKTPLTLIKMPLDKLLNQADMSQEQVNFNLKIMQKNTDRLINLTQELLDFRKAEADSFRLSFTQTDINQLLKTVFKDFESLAREKGISFTLTLPRLALSAFIDEEAMKKILSNLISNAIKYAGSKASVKLLPFNSDDIVFNIECENDGFVISEHEREKIFEPFYRIKETAKEAGSGIGLPLAKSLAELHLGTLKYITTKDNQNLFLLSIPIHQEKEIVIGSNILATPEQEEDLPQAATAAQDRNTKILLVEDNEDMLGFLQNELGSGFEIVTAANGMEALEQLDEHNIQLIISDIMMPVMDGIELCKRVKSELTYSHIPIILLTAKNSIQSKIEGLENGADAYIEKPCNMEYLQAQIRNLLNNRSLIKDYFTKTPFTHLKSMNISNRDKDFLQSLTQVIYDRIDNDELNVDYLSKMLNMSRPSLYRKVKGISDLTPNELIHVTRLKRSAEILAEGSVRINEVAMMVGYSVPSNFSRDFNKQFGLTPSQYLEQIQNSK